MTQESALDITLGRKTASPSSPRDLGAATVVTRDLRATQVAGAETIPGGADARRRPGNSPLARRLEGRK